MRYKLNPFILTLLLFWIAVGAYFIWFNKAEPQDINIELQEIGTNFDNPIYEGKG